MQDNSEQIMETSPETKPERKNRTALYIILGVILVIVLASAAFFAGRLMTQKAGNPMGPQMIVGPGGAAGGVGNVISMQIEVLPAAELPQTQPEVNGIFNHRDDNSIFLGTFSGGMGIVTSGASSSSDGGPSIEFNGPTADGPQVEVVITADTRIYKDSTEMVPPSLAEGETSQTVQQSVEEGSLDELGSNSMITVWGTRTGDRVVADVILYSQPMMFSVPAP